MKKILACLVSGLILLAGQGTQAVGSYSIGVRFASATMPGTNTCLVGYAPTCKTVITHSQTSSDPAICNIDIESNGQTIVVQDVNSVAWLNNSIGSSGSVTTWTWAAPNDSACRTFPSGVYVDATGTGSTTYSATIKYNP